MIPPVESHFFCADCEEEVQGLPFGARKGDRRPLCERCTRNGLTQGVAEPAIGSQRRVFPTDPEGPKYGLMSIGVLIFCMLIILGAAVLILLAMPHHR
jgi:hypothetical protein